MYYGAWFSTCHGPLSMEPLAMCFCSRRGQQKALTFFSGKLQGSFLSVSAAYRTCVRPLWALCILCSACRQLCCFPPELSILGSFAKGGVWVWEGRSFAVQGVCEVPKESCEKCYFFKPPPWKKGWNLMLAVFLFKLLGKPDQIGLSGWIVSNCWLAIATSAFKKKNKK